MFKFLKKKFKENEEKAEALGKTKFDGEGEEIDEEEADEFADNLFEKELLKGGKFDSKKSNFKYIQS